MRPENGIPPRAEAECLRMPGVLVNHLEFRLLYRTSLRLPCQVTSHLRRECFEAARSGNVAHVQHLLRSETHAQGQNVINKPDAAFRYGRAEVATLCILTFNRNHRRQCERQPVAKLFDYHSKARVCGELGHISDGIGLTEIHIVEYSIVVTSSTCTHDVQNSRIHVFHLRHRSSCPT